MPLRLLLAALLPLSGAAQVRVQGVPEAAPAVGGQSGAGRLSAPALPAAVPSLSAPLTPSLALPSAQPPAAVAAAPAAVAVAAPAKAAVLPASAVAAHAAPSVVAAAAPAAPPAAAPAAREAQAAPGAEAAGRAPTGEAAALTGRTFFDGASSPRNGALGDAPVPAAPSLWSRVRGLLRGADAAPSFPPKPDQKVRVAGKTYTLGRLAASGEGWALHEMAGFGRSEEAVLVFSPEAKASFEAEKAALEALARTDVPHPQLKAAGDGVLVLVTRNLDGWKTRDILRQGLSRSQANGLADAAARFIRLGTTADLSPDAVLWEHWRSWWALKRGTGYRPGSAWDTLSQLWSWPGAVPDRGAFLSALRGRLGPDSQAWRRVVAEADGVPDLRQAFAELARRDAARPPPAPLEFAAGRRDKVFTDELVTPGAVAKRLGFDPLTVKTRAALHADDPGKLNTSVSMLEGPGGRKVVFKGAEERIIRDELFVRKVVREFFGRYFDTPGALAVLRGFDSYMVMEVAQGGRTYTRPKLTRERRAALALLVHTFGLGDMNQGNVFYGEPVWLIDFEQALSRHRPNHNRIPDEGILWEMPWVNADDPLVIEDFLPAVKAWRAFFARPETQRAVETMLVESGYKPAEAAALMGTLRGNVADLEGTIQADVDFADGLLRR